MEFFEGIEPLLRGFWFVAIPATIIFLIQTIMTFTGGDVTDGTSADFDGDLSGGDVPFQLFSLRNLVNFLLGFGWTGISLYNIVPNHALLLAIATLVGIGFVYIFFIIIKQVVKLAEDNSFRLTSVLARTGEVYLPIPAGNKGKGKVLVSVKGAVHELDAITRGERLETGSIVKVTEITGDNILIVELV